MRSRTAEKSIAITACQGFVACAFIGTTFQLGAAGDPADKTLELLKTFVAEFVDITPGEGRFPASFEMGSNDGEASERPIHAVKVSRRFSMAKYEVPQNLYEAVMGQNPSRWKGPRNSVEMLSWNEANDFCRKATALLREQELIAKDEAIRLPTEAEWEYCCRAGTTTSYSFGEAQLTDETGKFDVVMGSFGNSKIQAIKVVREITGLGLKDAKDLVESLPKPLKSGVSKDDAEAVKAKIAEVGGVCFVRERMQLSRYAWHTGNAAGNDPPVGALLPNPWGLYDMHGYLWEFTADGWSSDYSQAAPDGSPVKPVGYVVIRSGSWKDGSEKLTSSARRKIKVTDADDAIGIRCVKSHAN